MATVQLNLALSGAANGRSLNFSWPDIALLRLGEILRDSGYRFTTVTPATHERVNGAAPLWARNLRDVFGWSRPFRQEILLRPMLELMHNAKVIAADGEGWRSTVRFSTLDDRIFVHSAFPTIADDAVFFGPDTYRFCAFVQRFLQPGSLYVQRACDIGCGSGAAALAIAHTFPAADIYAVDINETALRMTGINAVLATAINVVATHSNLYSDVDGDFDLIVANPPYMVDPKKRAYRHGGEQHGAALSLAIVDAALPRLTPGGTLLLYTGAAVIDGEDLFQRAVYERLKETGMRWRYDEIDPDVFGEEVGRDGYRDVERIAAIGLTVTRPL